MTRARRFTAVLVFHDGKRTEALVAFGPDGKPPRIVEVGTRKELRRFRRASKDDNGRLLYRETTKKSKSKERGS